MPIRASIAKTVPRYQAPKTGELALPPKSTRKNMSAEKWRP